MLRDYQKDICSRTVEAFRNHRSVMVQMPTGTGKTVVLTSSIAPYGAAEELKEETTQPTPNTPYGISKLVTEKIHQAWLNGGKDRHLTIVRPGVVFGKGENGNFTRLYNFYMRKYFGNILCNR